MFNECRDCANREIGQDVCTLALVGSEIGGCSGFVVAGDHEEGPESTTNPSEISTTVVIKDLKGAEGVVGTPTVTTVPTNLSIALSETAAANQAAMAEFEDKND